MKIYDFEVLDANQQPVKLDKYQGKVLLIVNSAPKCGFAYQLKTLEELYQKYHDQGFEILDFPCNQFANQAPGTQCEIQALSNNIVQNTFERFLKIDVNGENESPLYRYLKSQKGGFFNKEIKWNFTKFLISREGKVIKRFSPTTKPEKIEKSIITLLNH